MKFLFRVFILFSLLLTLDACRSGNKFEEVVSFDAGIWNRFNILSFDFDVSQLKHAYEINAVVNFTNDFPQSSLPLHIILTSPTGEERIWEKTLLLKTDEGLLLGKRYKNYQQVIFPLRSNHLFSETGKHKIVIEQVIPKYDTPGLLAFGIKVEKD